MIHIYYTQLAAPLQANKFSEYLELMPSGFKENILKFKRWEDAHTSLLGKILLMEGLADMGYKDMTIDRIKMNEYGRPYFQEKIDFNISHSANAVVCAITDKGKIGIDIEKKSVIELDDFKKFLRPEEWILLKSSPEPLSLFYELWTRKEAVIKAIGKGLSIPLQDVILHDNSATYRKENLFLTSIQIDKEYSVTVASEYDNPIVLHKKSYH